MKRLALLLILFAVPAQAWIRKPLFQVVPGSPFTGGSGGGSSTPSFPLLAPNGTQAAPSYSFSGTPGSGLYHDASAPEYLVLKGQTCTGTDTNCSHTEVWGGRGTGLGNGGQIGLQVAPPGSASGSSANALQYGLLIRGDIGTITLGRLNVNGSQGTTTIGSTNRTTGRTDGNAGNTTIQGGQGTGTGVGGNITLEVAPPGTTGSTQNALQTLMTLSATDLGITLGGGNFATPGNSQFSGANSLASNTAGATVTIKGGNAGAGNANGGDITLTGGTLVGTGVTGRVVVSASTWMQQAGGRSTQASDFTNATTGLTNTSLIAPSQVVNGRKYTWYLNLFLTESIAADGVKLDFAGGSATATNFVGNCVLTNAVGVGVTQTNAATAALATVINAAATTDANQHFYSCAGSFEPSSTGTFIVRAAQNAHSTGTLTIKRGSWLWLEDTP